MTASSEPSLFRRHLYTLLIVVAGCMALGRIFNAELVYEPSLFRKAGDPSYAGRPWPPDRPEPMPTFSSNDRSRWATVRALVENGTYVIGHRSPAPAVLVPGVQAASTVGLLSTPGGAGPLLVSSVIVAGKKPKEYVDEGIVFEDGWQTVDKVMNPDTRDFYSSKPPLLPTLMAGEYWLLKHAFGWSIATHRWAVVRTIVLTFNWLPWLLYLWLLSRLLERFGATDWGRLYVFATGCFGTLMTPFLVSINNHTLATCSALIALYFMAQVFLSESPRWWWFALAGFFAAFTATDELPAVSFTAALGLLMLWRFPRQTLCFFAPAALVPVAAFLLTNYLAIGELMPAYSKRDTAWYRYEGSHWAKVPDPVKPGIDFAWTKEGRLTYAVHVLVGHHGLFSLTPVFVLAMVGMLWGVWRLRIDEKNDGMQPSPAETLPSNPQSLWSWLAALTLVLTVIVAGFYLIRTDNYGGWTAGPRWLMWLTPFWLLTMLPVVDRLGRSRAGRVVAYILLGVSVMSMSYPAWNPWRHPWIYTFMDAHGWIPY